jgi:hypothetical protein
MKTVMRPSQNGPEVTSQELMLSRKLRRFVAIITFLAVILSLDTTANLLIPRGEPRQCQTIIALVVPDEVPDELMGSQRATKLLK